MDNISFYKMWLVTYSLCFSYNTIGKFHGWVDTMCDWIPWVDINYNTMGKYHGWMNTMVGCHLQYYGWIPWVDNYLVWMNTVVTKHVTEGCQSVRFHATISHQSFDQGLASLVREGSLTVYKYRLKSNKEG